MDLTRSTAADQSTFFTIQKKHSINNDLDMSSDAPSSTIDNILSNKISENEQSKHG